MRRALSRWALALLLTGCGGSDSVQQGISDVPRAPGGVSAGGEFDVARPADVEVGVVAPFVYSPACHLPDDPPGDAEVSLVNAFPNLTVSYRQKSSTTRRRPTGDC